MLSRNGLDYESLVKEDRVHISLYTNPAIFTVVIDKIFHRAWVYVGHRVEIPQAGDFRLTRIGLQPDHGSRPARTCVLNRCRAYSRRHRMSAGSRQHLAVSSMYHGWTICLTAS